MKKKKPNENDHMTTCLPVLIICRHRGFTPPMVPMYSPHPFSPMMHFFFFFAVVVAAIILGVR